MPVLVRVSVPIANQIQLCKAPIVIFADFFRSPLPIKDFATHMEGPVLVWTRLIGRQRAMEQRMDQRNNDTEAARNGRPSVSLMGKRIPIPRSRLARIGGGCMLVVLGLFGFLPVLGFWMIPLGLLILSYDIAFVRRQRRKVTVWWNRRSQRSQGQQSARDP